MSCRQLLTITPKAIWAVGEWSDSSVTTKMLAIQYTNRFSVFRARRSSAPTATPWPVGRSECLPLETAVSRLRLRSPSSESSKKRFPPLVPSHAHPADSGKRNEP